MLFQETQFFSGLQHEYESTISIVPNAHRRQLVHENNTTPPNFSSPMLHPNALSQAAERVGTEGLAHKGHFANLEERRTHDQISPGKRVVLWLRLLNSLYS